MEEQNPIVTDEDIILSTTDNTEGFTPEDYLWTPSWGTVSMEYSDERGEVMNKSNVFHNNTPILNQWNVWACAVFGITKAENEADFYDEKKILDAMKIRNEWVKDWVIPNGGKSWWNMNGALNLMMKKWYISWWYFCNDVDSIRDALERKHICYTGTRKCDWTGTKKSWVFTKATNTKTWHLFAIIGIDFDKECLIAANSWGEQRWVMDWLFEIPFENMVDLYTIVAVMDKPKDESDKDILDDIWDSKLMQEMWIWNWTNPDWDLWKLHAVYMVMRAFYASNLSDSDALKIAEDLWYVHNMSIPLTRRHFLIMVFRLAYWVTTREDVVPEIMRLLGIIKTTEHLDEPITRYHASLIIARMLRNLWKII